MPARWLGPLVALALPAAAAAHSAPEQASQALFERLLLDDSRTSAAVKGLLRSDAGFVTPQPTFADLTGDGRRDAVVTVHNAGAAGAVAVYVFSADGTRGGRLRTIYRRQSLYRARTRLAGGTLTVSAPDYARGDDLCCPAARIDRYYAWNSGSRLLRHRGTRTVRLPGQLR